MFPSRFLQQHFLRTTTEWGERMDGMKKQHFKRRSKIKAGQLQGLFKWQYGEIGWAKFG